MTIARRGVDDGVDVRMSRKDVSQFGTVCIVYVTAIENVVDAPGLRIFAFQKQHIMGVAQEPSQQVAADEPSCAG